MHRLYIKIISLSLCFSFLVSTPAFAEMKTIERDNYGGQYLTNWCWLATGRNFIVAAKSNGSSLSDAEIVDEMLDMCKVHFQNRGLKPTNDHGGVSPNHYTYDAMPYNRQLGLEDTKEICEENFSSKYNYSFSNQAFPFYMLRMDIRDYNTPEAFRLDKSGSGSHIILGIGYDDNGQQAYIYNPSGLGRQYWVDYNDLRTGDEALFPGSEIGGTMWGERK